MKKKIVFGILGVILIVAAVGYYLYSKKTTDYAAQEPDIQITATELLQAFESDTAAARQKFADKIVEVTGNVKSFDSSAVVLGEEGSASDVVVGLDDRHMQDIAQLKVGEQAMLQGKYSGYTKASGDDLLASLGTTVKIDYGGIKKK